MKQFKIEELHGLHNGQLKNKYEKMVTERKLQKITKNYNWNGGNNKGTNVYFSKDMQNILISQDLF